MVVGWLTGWVILSELAAVRVRVREGKGRMIEEIEESCPNRELSALPSEYYKESHFESASYRTPGTDFCVGPLSPPGGRFSPSSLTR